MKRSRLKILFIIPFLLISGQLLSSNGFIETMTRSDRIADIKFRGIRPFFSNELLDVMTIYPGNIYDSLKTESQKEILQEYFKRKGFYSPDVETVSRKIKNGLVEVSVRVKMNGYYRLKDVEVDGNVYYSSLRLKKELGSFWRGFLYGYRGRLVPDQIESDVKKLTEFYRENGFADIEITNEINIDSLTGDASVIFKINEGPKYKVELTGNSFFWNRSLSDETDMIFKARNGTAGARQIVRSVRKRYKDEGFNSAKVAWNDSVLTSNGTEKRILGINITEGERIIISDVNFEGNDSFKGEVLRNYLNSIVRRWWRFNEYFNKDFWEDDERNITAFYNRNGFLKARVAGSLKYSAKKDSVKITMLINEGVKTEVREAVFEGSFEEIAEDVGKIKYELTGKAYNAGLLSERTDRIKGLLASKGFIYADVINETVFGPDSAFADVKYKIEKAHKADVGKVYPAGNLKTKGGTVKKLLQVKEGEAFSILGLSSGSRNLRDQKIFKTVSVFTPGMEDKKDTVDIVVEVSEFPPYYFQMSGGYESYLGPYASMNSGNRNLWGRNKEISFKADASFVKQSVSAAFTEPFFLIPGLSANISPYWEKEESFNLDFGTEVLGIGAGVNYRWEKRLRSVLQAQAENKNFYSSSVSGADSNTVSNIGRVTFSHLWDGRDSFMLPKKGTYINFETVFSTGIDNTENDFIKLKIEAKYFAEPVRFVTAAFSAKYMQLKQFTTSTEPPQDQLFYLGGTSSVRGIGENMFLTDSSNGPVGGKEAALFTFEPRFEFKKNWELPLFFDTGLISGTPSGSGSTVRSTAGTGLRYITPIGAMGILWGFPLDIKDGWKDGVFHFSIGYTF